ncbi:MAG: shikimate dehydrogenase, partial [Kiritimatiellae bacterium]|nr:shikimate dehydrogenase [Kiritimatiellia bacterium]
GTPVGMWPRAGGIPVDPAALHAGLADFDPVYCPTPSRLVLNARKSGARAVGGLAMLVRQAVAAQRIWNPGLALDEDALLASLLPALAADLWRKNATKVLLTGFMGAGKSTAGRALAERLGLPFADLDDEIAAAAGAPIPAIFAAKGEDGFRALETETARRVLSRPGSEVVASGGGFPTLERNRALVRETNTLVLHLDAPFETLWARLAGGDGRPLAKKSEETAALYDRRAPIYRAFCDFAVPTTNDAPADGVAAALADALAPSA